MINKYSKTYRELHPIKLNVRKSTCWQNEPSEDYSVCPLCGTTARNYEEQCFIQDIGYCGACDHVQSEIEMMIERRDPDNREIN